MKQIHACYSPKTRAAIVAFNKTMEAVAASRTAAETERAAILADALEGKADAATIRRRADAVKLSELQGDLSERAALAPLSGVWEMAKKDFEAETDRQAALAAKREAELDAKAEELGAGPMQRHYMQVEDKVWGQHEAARQEAQSMASVGIATEADTQRRGALELEIGAAVRALLR